MSIRTFQQRLRAHLYKALFNSLGNAGLSVRFAEDYAGSGVIFMFHRIIQPGASTLYPGYELPVTFLDQCLEYVIQAGWRIVTLEDIRKHLVDGSSSERLACFTFDDGYSDNYTLALPVFRKYNVPMCVYIATNILDRSMFYWWGALKELVLFNDTVEIQLPNDPAGLRKLETYSLEQKQAAYDFLDAWCHRNEPIAEPVLRRLFKHYGLDVQRLLDRDALTPEQTRLFAQDPLVTIGSHGISHRRMNLLTDDELRNEMGTSRRILQNCTGQPVEHIAYPFGARDSCGQREFEAARASGYKTAVTTRRGNLFPSHRSSLYCLPRRVVTRLAETRNALYGVETILRHEPLFVTD